MLILPPASIDRSYTNKAVIEKLKTHHGIEFEDKATTWRQRKVKLQGRIVRAKRYDSLRRVLYMKGTLIPRVEYKKRVGVPKLIWMKETYKDAWRLTFDEDSPLHFNADRQDRLDNIHITKNIQRRNCCT
jgi:hypothetical protein